MRSFAYAVAILAAAGIMIFIAMNPAEPPAMDSETATASAEASSSVTPDNVELASLTLNVPKMHCPYACYPSVKEELESRDDVLTVELAPQKQEGVIDNRQVIVSYKEGFQVDEAIAMLESAGFDGSTVAQ